MESVEKILKNWDLGEYRWIDPADISVAHWVRTKCTFGCPDYGNAACPPNVPGVEECRAFFSEYSKALVFRFSFTAEKGHYPKDLDRRFSEALLDLERTLFLNGYYKAFNLNQNCCQLCENCADFRGGCRNPKNCRPSAEAFAVDVYGTVRAAGFPIDVVKSERQAINRYAFVMVE